jgi:hypothetical protein
VYVYLNSGEVEVIPEVSHIRVADRTMQVYRDGALVREYPRSNIYFATQSPIAPPSME